MLKRYTSGLLVMSFSMAVHSAPRDIDAGEIMNNIERNDPYKIDSVIPKIEPQQDSLPSESDFTINIKKIHFTGNQALKNEQIDEFLKQYLNTPLTVEQIKSIPANLSLFYRQNNLIAEITLPDQDITEGNLEIVIVEAKMGDISIDIDQQSGIKSNYLRQYFKTPQEGQLNLKFIAQRILVVNELPGLKAEAELRPGTEIGSTDVVIKAKESSRFITNLSYDNYGSRSTGSQRAIASAILNNPFGVGDQISIVALKSEGVDFAKINYGIPVGYSGLRTNIFATYLEYDVILQEFDATKPYGYSNSLGLNFSYPLSLEPENKWTSEVGFEERSFKNKTLDGTSSDYQTRVSSININGLVLDGLFNSNAYNQVTMEFNHGQVDMSDSPSVHRNGDAAGANTQGAFNKLTFSATRTQFINGDWSILGKFLYQWADQNLDSSEKLYLGGPNGVRAFPLNEGSGSKGYIANLELQRTLPYDLAGSVFYDLGHVQQYIDNQTAANEDIVSNNRLTFKGYGLGLTWQGPYSSNIGLVVARRHGKNPDPATNGGDQDGSNKDNFVWLRAGVVF